MVIRFLILILLYNSLGFSATERLRTVKPSAGDYTSVGAAISGEVTASADLVTADEYLKIEVHAGDYTSVSGGVNFTGDTGGVVVDGFTTDATRYVWITSASGSKHTGELYDGSGDYTGIALRRTTLGGTTTAGVITTKDNYVFITNMIFETTVGTSSSYQYALQAYSGSVFILSGNNIYANGSTHAGANGGGILNQNGLVYSVNDFIYNTGAGGGIGVYHVKSSTSYSLFYNTTVKNHWVNLYVYPGSSYDNAKLRNVIATGATNLDFAGGNPDTIWHTCSSADGSMTSSLGGTVTSGTTSATFAFSSSDSCETTSGSTSTINTGADLSSDPDYPFSTDIVDTSRPSGASWDQGAWEYVSASGWTGKVNGVTNPAKVNGVAVSAISKVNGVA